MFPPDANGAVTGVVPSAATPNKEKIEPALIPAGTSIVTEVIAAL
jgi:hypothetical protein